MKNKIFIIILAVLAVIIAKELHHSFFTDQKYGYHHHLVYWSIRLAVLALFILVIGWKLKGIQEAWKARN